MSLSERVERMVFAFSFGDDRRKAVRELAADVKVLEDTVANLYTPRPRETWDEDDGPALWWMFPVSEPPYAGTPLDDDFPDYVTHWTPLPVVNP